MGNNQGREALGELRKRYQVELDSRGWQSTRLPGGLALADELADTLRDAAQPLHDSVATAYELESSHKEFAPLTVSLDRQGFRNLRESWISHFDLVLVPPSRGWALVVLNEEMEAFIVGPAGFFAAFCDQTT
jgi:hypothetical protein